MGRLPHVPPYDRVADVRDGRNVVRVQRWLGHHAASFTLDTYVHLLRDDLPEPMEARGNKKATGRMESDANSRTADPVRTAP